MYSIFPRKQSRYNISLNGKFLLVSRQKVNKNQQQLAKSLTIIIEVLCKYFYHGILFVKHLTVY